MERLSPCKCDESPALKLRCAIILSAALAPVALASDAPLTVFTELDVQARSEAMSVADTIGDFDGNLRGNAKVAYTHNEARVGVSKGSWALSAFSRYDYYLDFDPDTAEFHYIDRNNLSVETGQTYRIELDAIQATTTGLSLDYAFNRGMKFSLKSRLSLLKGHHLVDGTIAGGIEINDEGNTTGLATVHYFYSEDGLFDRPDVRRPDGRGVTLDVFSAYRINQELMVSVQAEDLFSRIEWKNAPVTSATLNSTRIKYDEQGLLMVEPVLSGLETYQDFRQTFPQRYRLLLDYTPSRAPDHAAAGPVNWQLEINQIRHREYYRVNVSYTVTNNLRLDLSAGFRPRALGLGFRYRALAFFVMTDKAHLSDARTLELHCRLGFSF